MKKIMIAVSLALTLSSGSTQADVVYCVNCTNEISDMMRQAQNFAEFSAQTSNMIQQLEVMRAQAARLSSKAPFSESAALLTKIMGTVNQGQALGYDLAKISSKFERQYPGFKVKGSYYDNYNNWSQSTNDSIKAALMASGLQMENFANESATAETLRNMNQSAGGQMQALQIGNAVSSEMLDEMRKLRQLNTAQNQAQNAYMLGLQQKSDTKEAQSKAFYDQETVNPKYIKNLK